MPASRRPAAERNGPVVAEPPLTCLHILETLSSAQFSSLVREVLDEESSETSTTAVVALKSDPVAGRLAERDPRRVDTRCDFEIFESRGRIDAVRVSADGFSLFDITDADSDCWDELPAGRRILARDGAGRRLHIYWDHAPPAAPRLHFGGYSFPGNESLPVLAWLTEEIADLKNERRRPLWRSSK